MTRPLYLKYACNVVYNFDVMKIQIYYSIHIRIVGYDINYRCTQTFQAVLID